MINNKPLTGYMLLGLALEFVDCLNSEEAPVVNQCFERVVSIESERITEHLYEEIIDKINKNFNFPPLTDTKLPFENLERVYSYDEMDTFMDHLITECDEELSRRLKTILTVKQLVFVRNEFEERVTHYFDNNVRDVNKNLSRKFCHNLLDQIHTDYLFKLNELIKIKSV